MTPRLEAIWEQASTSSIPGLWWARSTPARDVGVVCGAFDPPTLAHLALVDAAGRWVGVGVACLSVVPLARGAPMLSAVERLRLLDASLPPNCGIAITTEATYLAMAGIFEAGGFAPVFIVGADKIPQLTDPSFYPDGQAGVDATFRDVDFAVVPRVGAPDVPTGMQTLDEPGIFADPDHAAISATEVRRRAAAGQGIRHLVPPPVADRLEGYTSGNGS